MQQFDPPSVTIAQNFFVPISVIIVSISLAKNSPV